MTNNHVRQWMIHYKRRQTYCKCTKLSLSKKTTLHSKGFTNVYKLQSIV